jgi:tyrosine-protein phosphatase non-receptor type 11
VKPVNTTRVNVGAISERVTALKNDKDLPVMGRAAGFSEEFERLQKQEGMNLHGRVEGRKPENTAKNRYKNILPFDTTRVVLTDGDPDVPGSDYINANYLKIDVRGEGCQYIATQGCLQNTIVDFWRMIWQENVSIIVMLTKLMEGSKNKCSRYWPNNSEGQKVLYMYDGQLTVKLREQSKTNDYEVNELELTKRIVKGDQVEDSDTRTVCHFHFLAWPDKSVPKDPGPLIDFMKAVTDKRRDINRIEPMGPIVVHCSAGIGRTGAYIVLDALLYHIDKHGLNCEIDIQKVVEEARAQRSGMVQTEEQYKFLYEVIKHYSETQKKRMVTQHLTSDEVPQEYGNLYFTKNGLKQSCSVPLSGASVSKPILSSEPVYENASAKFATSALSKEAGDAKASACPVYENARSNKRR